MTSSPDYRFHAAWLAITAVLLGLVWWLAPVASVAMLSGVRAGVDAAYAWVDRNRYSLGEAWPSPLRRLHRGPERFFAVP